jgi:zinc protease
MAAWDTFASIVGGSDTSRLVRVLRDDLQLVTSIDCSCYTPKYPCGLLGIGFFAMAKNSLPALKVIVQEIQRLAKVPPTREELVRVVNNLKAQRIYSQESMEGIARCAGLNLQTSQKMEFENFYMQSVSQVTPEHVRSIAQNVMQSIESGEFKISVALGHTALTEIQEQDFIDAFWQATKIVHHNQASLEQSHKNSPDATQEDWLCAYKQKISNINPAVKQIEIQLPHHKILKINFRLSKRLPVTSGIVLFKSGLIHEPAGKNGVGGLTASLLTRGTLRQNYRKFIEELEDNASSISAFSSRDLFGLRFDAIQENSLRTTQMLLDCLFRPEMSFEQWQKVHKETLEVLIAQKDNPSVRLARLNQPLLFPNHPYAFLGMGTEESLNNITLEDVRTFWSQLSQASEFVFSISGNFDLRSFVNLIESEFKTFFDSSVLPQKHPVTPPQPWFPTTPKVGFDEMQREQAHIMVSFRSFSIQDSRRTALEIAANILAGQGGRLFLDLRDQKSLAYSVSASHSPALFGGVFAAYIATAAHKAQEALLGLKAHIERLASSEPPTAEELKRAQNSVLGAQSIESQHHSSQAAQLALGDIYGHEFDHFLKFSQRVHAMTPETVSSVLRLLLKENPPLFSVVGPKGTWIPNENDPSLRWNLGDF